ncbi:hypothetical protein SPBR_02649 [Sporothrix brasiliensis 5110]|uniref:Zn(2)-C6 fungal-type domain-containing protein n=1 Tax=Sporothrix brasiliensis 5110 TaxID=1398154 RepID=A0A0C2J2F3_9PEZI|nr:uncharacterized protein SPBR_02649 [Sporothrix brasiliensis 5110]KIH93220.1 hypothetical protein SPBR_02649 [Sporothrix brasiliensis 5110]
METARHNHACARCSERKVKCDRKRPCEACVRLDLDCDFLPLPPRNRRRRPNNANVQIQALAGQLREYEAWFRERGIDPESLPVNIPRQRESEPSEKEPLHTAQSTQSAQSIQSTPSGASPGRLRLASKCVVVPVFTILSRVADNNSVLWTRVIEEFDPQDDLNITHDGSSDDEVEVRLKGTPGNTGVGPSFIFANRPSPHGYRPEHPPLDMSRRLWQVYCENVDPLTKVLHMPTVKHAMENAFRDTPAVPRAFEALLFAVYAAAVMSLREDDCSKTLGEPRSVLLPRYLAATETALMRANVLGTTDIIVLQALLLYLLAVRDLHEPRAVWTLTGVAIRLAEGMGLDRDGLRESPPLPPFDVEMRRRLWWQLRVHDFRTAELCGRPKFQDLDVDSTLTAGSTAALATQWPANVDDAALGPAMAGSPLPPLGEASSATDAVFVAVKCELLRFTAARLSALRRQQIPGPSTNPWRLYTTSALDNDFADIEARLETRYLRYCDPSKPLHLMATLMARCAINILRFMTRHP